MVFQVFVEAEHILLPNDLYCQSTFEEFSLTAPTPLQVSRQHLLDFFQCLMIIWALQECVILQWWEKSQSQAIDQRVLLRLKDQEVASHPSEWQLALLQIFLYNIKNVIFCSSLGVQFSVFFSSVVSCPKLLEVSVWIKAAARSLSTVRSSATEGPGDIIFLGRQDLIGGNGVLAFSSTRDSSLYDIELEDSCSLPLLLLLPLLPWLSFSSLPVFLSVLSTAFLILQSLGLLMSLILFFLPPSELIRTVCLIHSLWALMPLHMRRQTGFLADLWRLFHCTLGYLIFLMHFSSVSSRLPLSMKLRNFLNNVIFSFCWNSCSLPEIRYLFVNHICSLSKIFFNASKLVQESKTWPFEGNLEPLIISSDLDIK